MIRTRLLWSSLGFASTSVAIAQFIFKDLWFERNSLASQLKEKFNSLDARVSNLESVVSNRPTSSQDYDNLLEKIGKIEKIEKGRKQILDEAPDS